MKKAFTICLALALAGPLLAAEVAVSKGAQAFWAKFRAAVMTDDANKVATMVQFPLKTKGEMDDDPVIERDSKWFVANYSKLIAADPGLSPQSATVRALIEHTPELAPLNMMDADNWRVGSFQFAKVKNKYLLVFVYWAE